MLPLPTTTVRAAHQAIEAGLRAHFGSAILQYGPYQPWDSVDDEPETELLTPALLLELESIDPDDAALHQPGRIAIRCAWAVHAVLSIRTEDLQIALPELAAAVMTLVRKNETDPARPPLTANRWGLAEAVGPPEALSARPGEFTPGLNGRDAWIIAWEQTLYLPQTLPTD